MSERIVFMHLPGETEAVPAGRLTIIEQGLQVQASRFSYGRRYLQRANAVPVDPGDDRPGQGHCTNGAESPWVRRRYRPPPCPILRSRHDGRRARSHHRRPAPGVPPTTTARHRFPEHGGPSRCPAHRQWPLASGRRRLPAPTCAGIPRLPPMTVYRWPIRRAPTTHAACTKPVRE